MENRPEQGKGKYVTLVVLVVIVTAIFLWTLNSTR